MSDERNCPHCGEPIPDDAPEGKLCPKCLIQAGLASSGPTMTGFRTGARFTPPDPEELAPHFPNLEILELIGQGGMGAVYKARQTKLDRIVALKILDSDAARGPVFAERFMREARTLAKVSHANIVGIHDFGEAGDRYYFVMEYVDGASLRDVLATGELTPDEALQLVPQLCDALQFAHEEGVVHRDIKPENILIDRRGRVKIADFGLAKILQPEQTDFTLTVPGQVMGTPAYMAPEQIEKPMHVDHRADIYSLGVVFYEMLTGELPLGRFAPPSRKVCVDVRLDEVVLRTLEKEPERRYQHASQVKTEVESIDDDPGPEKKKTTKKKKTMWEDPETIVAGITIGGGSPSNPEPIGEKTPDGGRRIVVHRPTGVTMVAVWCFVFVALTSLLHLPLQNRGVMIGSSRMLLSQFSSMGLPFPVGSFLFPTLHWALAAWAVATGVGLLRLQRWARPSAIALSFVGLTLLVPLGVILSTMILIYLFRGDVARLFELGEGSAEVSEDDARRLARILG